MFTFVPLKNITIILLLSIYLVSATEIHQLLKLPLLIEHFKEHKSKNRNLSLYQFLAMHYATDNDNDGDRDKDMKLPFKSDSECAFSPLFAFTQNTTICITSLVYKIVNLITIKNDTFIPSTVLSSIWQPPKY